MGRARKERPEEEMSERRREAEQVREAGDTEKITITMPSVLLRKVDRMAEEHGMSRSMLISDLVGHGYRQTSITRRLLSNRYVLKAFQLVFNIKPEDYDAEIAAHPAKDAATETVRRTILTELKKISLAQAEAEIDRDIGLGKERDTKNNTPEP